MQCVEVLYGAADRPVTPRRFPSHQVRQRRVYTDETQFEWRQQCRKLTMPALCVEDVLDDQVVAGLGVGGERAVEP